MKHNHDFSRQCCHNPDCPDYHVKGRGNVKFHAHYGRDNSIRELRCVTCSRLFSENKGTAFFDLRMSKDRFMTIVKLLCEGNGMRGTARITNVHRDTVSRILEKAALHCEKMDEEFLKDLEANEIQLDELWTFIKKKRMEKVNRKKN